MFIFILLFCRFSLFSIAIINPTKIMLFSSIKSSIQILLLILKFLIFLTHKRSNHILHPLAFQQLSMGDFKSLNLINLSFRNKKIEKFVNREKKCIKFYSLVMKFGRNFLDFRDKNGKMCCCVNICYKEKR